jgi:hypothetical protein
MRRSTTTGLILASGIAGPQLAEAHALPPHGQHAVWSSTINGCRMAGIHDNVRAHFMTAGGGTQSDRCQTVGVRVYAATAHDFGGGHPAWWSSWDYDGGLAWVNVDVTSTPCGSNACGGLSWALVKTNHYRWHGGAGSAEVTSYAK